MSSELLRAMIRDAARLAFTAVQTEHPGVPFYTFSLQTMSDATGVYAHANTEDGYRQAVECYRGREPDAVDERYCRWYWAEWAYRNLDAPGFDRIYLYLNPGVEPEYLGLSADDPAPIVRVPNGGEGKWPLVFASMVAALGDLDREGVFGRDPARDRITLFCSVEDSPDDPWVTEESAARLNPAGAYHRCKVDGPVILARGRPDPDDPWVADTVRLLDGWGFPRRAEPSAAADGGA